METFRRLQKTAKQLALLAETLERRSATAISTQERSALDLHNAVSTARANIEQFLQSAYREIEAPPYDIRLDRGLYSAIFFVFTRVIIEPVAC